MVRAALDEDLGFGRSPRPGDLTSLATIPAEASARARIIAKQDLILAGLPLAEMVFYTLDRSALLTTDYADSAPVKPGCMVVEIESNTRAILAGERTALNFLGHLSGIATLTRRFVDAVAGTDARIRDTRKTTPLHRAIEKYAVRTGGGSNHRFGLFDAVLIKENHIVAAGGIREALRRAQEHVAGLEPVTSAATAYESFAPGGASSGEESGIVIQIEVRNEAELREALAAGAGCILLDNQSPESAAALLAIARRVAPACTIEISGGVTLANVRAYAEAGPDFIAIGALTHSAPAADFSLLVAPTRVR
ncbi:MAG: nicotinate-nucleotide diphosphorylase [Candidatus Acidiferrales bacterium]